MIPEIADSARRHGLSDDDILHAYRNPIRVHSLDELEMLVGADRSGRMLEVGVVIDRDKQIDVIVHAMPMRPRFLDRQP